MPAIYVCDLCGKHQPMEEQLTVVAREPDPEEGICEECCRFHIQPNWTRPPRQRWGGETNPHPPKLNRCMLKSPRRSAKNELGGEGNRQLRWGLSVTPRRRYSVCGQPT